MSSDIQKSLRRIVRLALAGATVSVLYYVSATFGLAMSFEPEAIGAMWPPNAIVLAVLLMEPRQRWWIYILAIFPGELMADLPAGVSLQDALAFGLADALEVLLAAALLRRWIILPAAFGSLRQSMVFVLIAALLVPFVVGGLWAGYHWIVDSEAQCILLWKRWFMGDALTHLTMTPFFLIWFSRARIRGVLGAAKRRVLEGLILSLVFVVVVYLSLASEIGGQLIASGIPSLVYVPLPFLLWAAVRFGPPGVTLAGFVLTLLSVWSASHGFGPFSSGIVETNVVGLQLFLFLALAPMLFLSSLVVEREQVNQIVREAAQRLALHLKHNPLGVIEWNRAFRVVEWNPSAEQIFGFRRGEAIGRHAWELMVEESEREEFQEIWTRLLNKDEQGERFTGSNITKEGSYKLCEWYNSPLVDADGEVFGVATVVQDITEKRMMEEEIRHTQKMEAVGRLAGGIAHDFNNLLTAILGHTELILLQPPEDEKIRIALDEIQKAGLRARDTVKQILGFSRQEEGERKPVELHLIVKEAVDLLRTSIPANIEIRSKIDKESGRILADPSQLHRVVMNLATNAYQAMREEGGVIELGVEGARARIGDELLEQDVIRLWVRDTGPGIDEATQKRIFDPFFTTKRVGDGSGMGLAVVHGIIANHKGSIHVDSKLGEGATFNVYFPMYEEESDRPDSQPRYYDYPRGSGRILLVDDEPVVAKIEAEMMRKLGYDVEVFGRPELALERFRGNPAGFDLIVSDQAMPELTGVQLAKRARELRADIPIVLCTGYSDVLNQAKAIELKLNGLLLKPVSFSDLAQSVHQAINGED